MLVIGILLTWGGIGALSGGIATAAGTAVQGADGYVSTKARPLVTSGYALTTPRVPGFTVAGDPGTLPFDLASVRLSVTAEDGGDIFVGIGPRADVERYLEGVEHSEVTAVEYDPYRVEYWLRPGQQEPTPPEDETLWVESSSGAGEQQISWSVEPGTWAAVIMNADASRGVSADVTAGIRSDLLGPLAAGLIIAGLAMLAIGIPLIVLGATGLGRGVTPAPHPSAFPSGPTTPFNGAPYPARLTGRLDPTLSRGLWLVKWLLALPHLIILIGLWLALGIVTIVAGFAILFTGRYPRPLFAYSVGVLRWTWRVGFYAYSALGTDRYPPFTLSSTDYPADFDIDYPEKLSRGLVLVKWWLLAIPHYLVIGILTGGAWWWDGWWRDGSRDVGISLLGILVLIAGVLLLFTGRYRAGHFDLVMGINRWAYRVFAYAALLRDEYPPFRLDQGPGYAPAVTGEEEKS